MNRHLYHEQSVFLFKYDGKYVVRRYQDDHGDQKYGLFGGSQYQMCDDHQLELGFQAMVSEVGFNPLAANWATRVRSHSMEMLLVKMRFWLNVIDLTEDEYAQLIRIGVLRTHIELIEHGDRVAKYSIYDGL